MILSGSLPAPFSFARWINIQSPLQTREIRRNVVITPDTGVIIKIDFVKIDFNKIGFTKRRIQNVYRAGRRAPIPGTQIIRYIIYIYFYSLVFQTCIDGRKEEQ